MHTLPLPLSTLPAWGLLTAAIVGLWVPPVGRGHFRLPFWMTLFPVSVGWGIVSGLLEPVAVVVIAALGLAVWLAEQKTLPTALRLSGALATLGLSLVLMLHRAPGFVPFTVIDGVRISPDALPYTRTLSFDKPVVGLLLLAFGHRRLSTAADWRRMLKTAAPFIPLVLLALLLLSFALGYVRLDVKWPPFGWLWIWTNLCFTCISEEALFRGFVQRHLARVLTRHAHGSRMALGLAALLFGLAHFAGGIRYVALATAAGWGYGFVYLRTRRIEAAVLMHFALNLVHFVFFTYPALAGAL